ncbi:MAG: nucleotide-binding universal stress UspA family protein [Gammaproteobacteria bacterium]|jgi:nucleotide-binding universal stress UspA family protein
MINIQHILHPTDFGDNSSEALKYACSLATQFSANLHVLNVVQDINVIVGPLGGVVPMDFNQKQLQIANEKIGEIPDKIINFRGDITRNVVEGTPFVEIIRYAKDNVIDLIVMGTHGYSGLEHFLIGSVAENVVRKAPCPVLTVHPKDYKFVMP